MEQEIQVSGLSSRGYKVPYSSFTIRPFSPDQLFLLAEAEATRDYEPMIEALQAVTSEDINHLSTSDFYQLLAWQRDKCFPETPIQMNWRCPSTVEGAKCNHVNKATFAWEDLEVIYLPEDLELPEGFDIPRIAQLAEFKRAVQDPKNVRIYAGLQWIDQGNTLQKRLNFLKGQPDFTILDNAFRLNQEYSHGIVKLVSGSCEKCNHEVVQSLDIDMTSFFR